MCVAWDIAMVIITIPNAVNLGVAALSMTGIHTTPITPAQPLLLTVMSICHLQKVFAGG